MKAKLLFWVIILCLIPISVNAVLPTTSNVVASYSCDNVDVSGATLNDEKNDYKLDGNMVSTIKTGENGIIGQACLGTGATSDGIRINRSTTPLDAMFDSGNWSVETWIRTNTTQTDYPWGTEDAANWITRFGVNDVVGNGRLTAIHLDGTGLNSNFVGAGKGAWVHTVVTYNTTDKQLMGC